MWNGGCFRGTLWHDGVWVWATKVHDDGLGWLTKHQTCEIALTIHWIPNGHSVRHAGLPLNIDDAAIFCLITTVIWWYLRSDRSSLLSKMSMCHTSLEQSINQSIYRKTRYMSLVRASASQERSTAQLPHRHTIICGPTLLSEAFYWNELRRKKIVATQSNWS